MAPFKKQKADILGQRFGRLVVLERNGLNKSGSGAAWLCKCDCGNVDTFSSFYLTNGLPCNKSCGCLKPEEDTKSRKVGREIKRLKNTEPKGLIEARNYARSLQNKWGA